MAARDIPSLFIESDLVDRRAVSEAQLKSRPEFAKLQFEELVARKTPAQNSDDL